MYIMSRWAYDSKVCIQNILCILVKYIVYILQYRGLASEDFLGIRGFKQTDSNANWLQEHLILEHIRVKRSMQSPVKFTQNST
jgi:hypothetical protein